MSGKAAFFAMLTAILFAGGMTGLVYTGQNEMRPIIVIPALLAVMGSFVSFDVAREALSSDGSEL